jgi:1-acyl-sn-glycerol-3-phosphate acyltransferase
VIIRWILGTWVRVALWLFFRRIELVFHAPLPMDRCAVLAGTHQNALLDSILLAAKSPRPPFTLSRGSLFDRRVAAWFLESLQMIPVFRFRDGFRKMRRNPEMFGAYQEVLAGGGWLLIFPEGSHFLKFTLRPFQKGVARIVFHAQEAQSWEEEIPVFPVGLQYEEHEAFGTRLLIQYGPPVSSVAYEALHDENPKKAERAFTQELFSRTEPLLVLPPQEDVAYQDALRRWKRNRGRFKDLMEQFRSDQALMNRMGPEPPAGSGREKDLEASPAPSAGPTPGSMVPATRRVLGWVCSLPGILLHLPPILGVRFWKRKLIKDPHLVPAMSFVAGMFLFPAWYLLLLFGLWQLAGGWTAALVMPVLPASLWLWSRLFHLTR